MAKNMKSLFKKFDAVLHKYNPVNYEALKPPLPRIEVESYMSSWGIDDDDLMQLLSWKNGFNFRGQIQNAIFEWGAFLSIERINRYFSTDYTMEPQIDASGKRIFISLTENGSGDSLLYNLQKENYGKIHLFSVALLYIDEPISYYDSLATMIETETEAYETGIYKVSNERGWLDVDLKRFFSLAKRLNPQSEYWKQI